MEGLVHGLSNFGYFKDYLVQFFILILTVFNMIKNLLFLGRWESESCALLVSYKIIVYIDKAL